MCVLCRYEWESEMRDGKARKKKVLLPCMRRILCNLTVQDRIEEGDGEKKNRGEE